MSNEKEIIKSTLAGEFEQSTNQGFVDEVTEKFTEGAIGEPIEESTIWMASTNTFVPFSEPVTIDIKLDENVIAMDKFIKDLKILLDKNLKNISNIVTAICEIDNPKLMDIPVTPIFTLIGKITDLKNKHKAVITEQTEGLINSMLSDFWNTNITEEQSNAVLKFFQSNELLYLLKGMDLLSTDKLIRPKPPVSIKPVGVVKQSTTTQPKSPVSTSISTLREARKNMHAKYSY